MLVIFFILIPFTNGYQNYIDMAISFYEESHIKSLCLLMCDDDHGSTSFVKHASSQNMVVSMVDINKLADDFSKFDVCMTHRVPMGILINTRCNAFEKIITYASAKMMLDSKRKWLIVDDFISTIDTVEELLNNIEDTNKESITNNTEDIERINNDNEDNIKSTNMCIDVNNTQLSNNSTDEYGIESFKNTKNCMKLTKNIAEDKSMLSYDLEDEIAIILGRLNVSVDADITIAKRTDSNTYGLYESFNFGKQQGGTLLIKRIQGGIRGMKINKLYTYYKRWDFNQINVNMIVVMSSIPEVFDPQMILGRVRDTRTAVISVAGTQMLHAIAEIHNFKFVYTIVDRWVGNFRRNGTYAVTNALYFREADVTPILRYIPAFVGYLDIVGTPISNIETRFYYRIPSYGPGKFENQFLTPLSTGAWWGVVGVCTVCGVVLLISSLFEERPFSLPYSFFSVFALVCQQFFEDTDEKGIKRSSAARKITILVTGLSCVLIFNYYTSSVVSWLLNGPPPSINSLWELINSPLQPMFEDIGYTRSWLQLPNYYYNKRNAEAEDKLKQRMYMNMKKMDIFRKVDDGIDLVKRGGYAYHTEVNGANDRISRTFDQRELCDMGSLQAMEKTMLFAAIQQNSPYKEFFGWSLMRLNERGIVSCIRNRMSSPESKCEGSSPRALALGGAAPAFILLAGGYILGTIIMLMERFIYRHRQWNIL